MKNTLIIPLLIILTLLPLACRQSPEKQAGKTTDLVTIKTLGLAYLEEFRHEEAEKEFLKFIKLSPDDKFGYANLGLVYLRLARYTEAETQLQKAVGIAPDDPDIRLLLATVYRMDNNRDKAREELLEALRIAPDHIKSLFELSELYLTDQDTKAREEREKCLSALVEKAPGNIVPYLLLTEVEISKNDFESATANLEKIRKQFPEFPAEAMEYYRKTISDLKKKDSKNAATNYAIFHNYMKVSNPYQAGMAEFKGPGGALIGFPVITFAQHTAGRIAENELLLDIVRYRDATQASGLVFNSNAENQDAIAALNDFDGDGDIDIFVSAPEPASGSYVPHLFRNETGRYTDIAAEAGLKFPGKATAAEFGDYDNDGNPDLFICREGGSILLRNTGKNTFEDISSTVKCNFGSGGRLPLMFDYDHDGDLDIFQALNDKLQLFRNNSDGTFTESSEAAGISSYSGSFTGAAFGDFDDDGDIDLIVGSGDSHPYLFSNQRQGTFRETATEAGLGSIAGCGSLAAGDFNNDGFLDLYLGSNGKTGNVLMKNRNNGTFEELSESKNIFTIPGKSVIKSSLFLDFNNDGWLDLAVVAGESSGSQGTLQLFYNNGKGNLEVSEGILPDLKTNPSGILVFDYNDDGDPDLLVTTTNGQARLLRNDGGNENHFIKMKLVGLRAGSAKNNHFGIGARVEMRAGELYQMQVVTDPNIHFGLGAREFADVIRITWTNGVPQNIFLPGSDQKLIEAQTLKGSCPFLYTWNGEKYEFEKDILWRSALGMPMGIMAGTRTFAFPDASDDYIKIDEGALVPDDGKYRIQVTSELWETIYTDKIGIVAVDHPASSDLFIPEQFAPPPFPGLKLFEINKRIVPVSATDSYGNDVLEKIRNNDFSYAGGFISGRYQGIVERNELILDPGPSSGQDKLLLLLRGWIFPTDASINAALAQSGTGSASAPEIQVPDRNGNWVTVFDRLGFPMGKDKTVIADLSGKFLSADHRVKIKTNMEIYWDQAFFSNEFSLAAYKPITLNPSSADLHYRGFSAVSRKGGRYGPHWFDYDSVDISQRWRDLTGNYTRYGDVLPLLKESDNMYVISNAGDEISIEFDAAELPALKNGWKRDFFIHSAGWVKDGDLNTAEGATVEPLPWHGMKNYPPSRNEKYPGREELEKYRKEYNTRIITGNEFRDAIKPSALGKQ